MPTTEIPVVTRLEDVPAIDQQVAELKEAGWILLTRTCWKAPSGSGCAGYFLGPHGAWKAMKRARAIEALGK